MSPLNSQTTYKDVTNSVLKFGEILFTPIQLTAMACYDAGPLKVRFSFRRQNVPPPPPNPLHKHRYISRHFISVHFSQLTNTVLTLLATIIASFGVHCGLKYQNWPMKQKLFLDQKGCQWRMYPHNTNKSNAQKLEIPTNIDVYSYKKTHRRASCNAGVIRRGCGVVTCNTQPSIY